MKAIKFYRPFVGDYTTRLAGRVFSFCRNHETQLISLENHDRIPLNDLFPLLHHLEFSDYSDLESEYADKSAVILCLDPENDALLQELFSLLKENEDRYRDDELKQVIPYYGRPELIEI